jgi:hypothetical protein
MQRPEFLDCATDEEWAEWYRMQKRVSSNNPATRPAAVVRNFCDDCTPEFFAWNAERGLCFQARIQDEVMTVEDIKLLLE